MQADYANVLVHHNAIAVEDGADALVDDEFGVLIREAFAISFARARVLAFVPSPGDLSNGVIKRLRGGCKLLRALRRDRALVHVESEANSKRGHILT